MARVFVVVAVLLLASVAGCAGRYEGPRPTPPTGGPTAEPALRLVPFIEGLDQPIAMVDAGDGRFLVAQQGGRVVLVRGGEVQAAPFLDLTAFVSKGGEQGLLGLALDPGYATNGRLYVDYTDLAGDSHIARFTRDTIVADRADPASMNDLLKVEQPYANHNGGHLTFGPDGKLYVGVGDGGSAGDPQNRAQNKGDLLGKILRLDVSGDAYTVPSDNPFANGGGRGEVWAYGLRNPWRFSFDRTTGDLYIGDVGQNKLEEIDYAAPAQQSGANYGWSVFEGSLQYRGGPSPGAVFPVYEYPTDDGCAVTGGYVYRGEAVPALHGVYLFSDYCNGIVQALWGAGGAWIHRILDRSERRISSFAQDAQGELYVLDHGGAVLKVVGAG